MSSTTDKSISLEFWCDSDYAGDRTDRKSRSGWLASLNGNTFMWKSRKQSSVSASTTESEYIALSTCTQDVQWVRQLLTEIGFDMTEATIIHEDNVASITWS